MLSVSKLARSCGLSRSTLLYYESVGLLKAAARTGAGYRCYGDAQIARLRLVCTYRNAGLRIKDILQILDQPQEGAVAVLNRRLGELNSEIETIRDHQHAILKLLRSAKSFRSKNAMTKEKWVSIMKAAGFSEDDMRRWHVEFERSAPEDHGEFLEFLHIPPAEIAAIREWSRKEVSPSA